MRCCGIRQVLRFIQGSRAKGARPIDNVLDLLGRPAMTRHFEENPNDMPEYALPGPKEGSRSQISDSRVLQPTVNRIFNNERYHPLHFARTDLATSGLCPEIIELLRKLCISELTPLQASFIPLFLKGKHVMAHAETGSGKSFGAALATANRIARDNINYRLHTLFLVPTTELALQYDRWFKHFGGCASQVVQVAIDDIPLESQLAKLHNVHPHVLVGTPQRVFDINTHCPILVGEKLRKKIDTLIVDEADIILSAPIHDQGRTLTGADLVDRLFRTQQNEVPAQMVAMSATIDGVSQQKLNGWMKNDQCVRLTSTSEEHALPDSMTFYFCPSSSSLCPSERDLLVRLLQLVYLQWAQPKILLFTSHDVDEVVADVNRVLLDLRSASGGAHKCVSIHSEDTHEILEETSPRDMRAANKEILVCNRSNVYALSIGNAAVGVGSYHIARGLHVPGVTHVILYGDAPSMAQFLHCAGRTARMGADGDILCIFPPSSGRGYQSICHGLDIPFHVTRVSQLDEALALAERRFSGAAPCGPAESAV